MMKKIIIIFLVSITIIFSLFILNNNNKLAYSVAVVISESMEPALLKNDLIIIKKDKEYKVNDIIVYKANGLIVHRIIRIENNEIITKGDSNYEEDKPILKENILGKVIFNIHYIGLFISFFKSIYGFVVVFLGVITLFIISLIKEINLNKDK